MGVPSPVGRHAVAEFDHATQGLVAETAVRDERVVPRPDVEFRPADVGPHDFGEHRARFRRREFVAVRLDDLRRFEGDDAPVSRGWHDGTHYSMG